MNPPDVEYLRLLADKCAHLVAERSDRPLDWSVESLARLDEVCAEVLEEGLEGERLDLWFQLIGAYTGEVVVRAYGGEWIEHEASPGAPAVRALGVTAFPFAVTSKILAGEPDKSLASFARVLPTVAEHANED